MPQLSELGKAIDLRNEQAPPVTPRPTRPQAAPRTTKELIAEANKSSNFDDESTEAIKLFKRSKDLVEARIAEDPDFEDQFTGKIQGLKGEKLAQAIIDTADSFRIEALKEKYPDRFNQGGAIATAFLNDASFGQLSRIVGYAGELLNGRPADEVIREKAEEFRLLQKAFPQSSLAGSALSFFVPGSPARKVFQVGANIGSKVVGKVLSTLVKNPGMFAKAAQAAGSLGAGAAATGAISGGLGSDLESLSLDRGLRDSLSAGIASSVIGFGVPVAAAGLSGAAEVAGPIVNKVAKSANRTIRRVVEQLSGTDARALRAFTRDSERLQKAFDSGKAIALDGVGEQQGFADFLIQQKFSRLPEVSKANELLTTRFPRVDAKPLIDYLKSIKSSNNPALDSQAKIVNEWGQRLANQVGKDGKVDASLFRTWIDELQQANSKFYSGDAPFVNATLIRAASKANVQLRKTAVEMAKSGQPEGQLYIDLMKKAADKRRILSFFYKRLGSKPEQIEQRAEGFINNLFGKNKTIQQRRMQELDRKFDTNFLELAKSADLARKLGNGGIPQLLPGQSTGKSLTSLAAGGLVAGGAAALGGQDSSSIGTAAVLGAVAASPRVGANIIGASDSVTGFLRKLVANPKAIERLARKSTGKTAARLRVPLEVRKIAQEIQNAFNTDGVESAAGIVRVAADTPYFLGLVHAFDVVERQQNEKNLGVALEQLKIQNSQLATPKN